jgi:hypothetical protein
MLVGHDGLQRAKIEIGEQRLVNVRFAPKSGHSNPT